MTNLAISRFNLKTLGWNSIKTIICWNCVKFHQNLWKFMENSIKNQLISLLIAELHFRSHESHFLKLFLTFSRPFPHAPISFQLNNDYRSWLYSVCFSQWKKDCATMHRDMHYKGEIAHSDNNIPINASLYNHDKCKIILNIFFFKSIFISLFQPIHSGNREKEIKLAILIFCQSAIIINWY